MTYHSEDNMRPIHPGEHLREDFLKPLGMSASALALALRLPAPRISDIVREKRSITPETAVRLAKYFGNRPEYWLRWQMDYDLRLVQEHESQALEEILPRALMAENG